MGLLPAVAFCHCQHLTQAFHIQVYIYLYPIYVYYHSQVWGHLEMSLFFKKSIVFFNDENIKRIRDTV